MMVVNDRNVWLYVNKERWLCSTDRKRFVIECYGLRGFRNEPCTS